MINKNYIAHPLKSPMYVELTLTEACNHKCVHCYNPYRTAKETVPLKISKNNIRKLQLELEKNEVFHLVISGGEPLSDWKLLNFLLSEMNDSTFSISVNSNLALANCSRLQEMKSKGVESILTSFPSSSSELFDEIVGKKGSFNHVVRGIKNCIKVNMPVYANIVISNKNKNTLYDSCEFLSNLGVKYIAATIASPPCFDLNNTNYLLTDVDIQEMADTLLCASEDFSFIPSTINTLPLCVLHDLKKYEALVARSCGGGITHMTIGSDGTAYACSHESMGYGNVFEKGIKKTWESMEKWKLGDNLHKECLACDVLDICGGECRIITEAFPLRNYPTRNNVYNIDNILISSVDISRLKSSLLSSNKDIKIREENFGGILHIKHRNVYLSPSGLDLVKWLIRQELTTYDKIKTKFYGFDTLPNVLNHLIHVGFLVPK